MARVILAVLLCAAMLAACDGQQVTSASTAATGSSKDGGVAAVTEWSNKTSICTWDKIGGACGMGLDYRSLNAITQLAPKALTPTAAGMWSSIQADSIAKKCSSISREPACNAITLQNFLDGVTPTGPESAGANLLPSALLGLLLSAMLLAMF